MRIVLCIIFSFVKYIILLFCEYEWFFVIEYIFIVSEVCEVCKFVKEIFWLYGENEFMNMVFYGVYIIFLM